jgi:hypothetical protein
VPGCTRPPTATTQLGLNDKLMHHGDADCGAGGLCLRLADRKVVCIARALIADPHVLVVCKPPSELSARHRAKVFGVICDWQQRRGLWEGCAGGSTGNLGTTAGSVLNSRTLLLGITDEGRVPDFVDIVGTLEVERGKDDPRSTITLRRNEPAADASDLLTLEDARAEVVRLRKQVAGPARPLVGEPTGEPEPEPEPQEPREKLLVMTAL